MQDLAIFDYSTGTIHLFQYSSEHFPDIENYIFESEEMSGYHFKPSQIHYMTGDIKLIKHAKHC